MSAARVFELRELDGETGALVRSVYAARWDPERPPARIISGVLDLGGGLAAVVEVRPARVLDAEGR